MGRRNPLAMLAGIAAVSAAMALVIREAQPSSPPAPPPPRKRQRTGADVITEHLVATWPGMTVEDAARLACAWPGQLSLIGPRRHQ